MRTRHKIITILGAAIIFSATHSFASEKGITEIACTQTNGPIDAGLVVQIESKMVKSTKLFTAKILRQSIMGPRTLRKLSVKSSERNLVRIFKGREFRLEINLTNLPVVPPADFVALLDTELNGHRISEAMSCSFVDSPITRPPSVCMAYWTGFKFDSRINGCVEGHAGGCSNPFPFSSRQECERANGIGN